jgi:hypothetical protein
MRDIYHEEKPMGHGLTLMNTDNERFYHEGHEEHEEVNAKTLKRSSPRRVRRNTKETERDADAR